MAKKKTPAPQRAGTGMLEGLQRMAVESPGDHLALVKLIARLAARQKKLERKST